GDDLETTLIAADAGVPTAERVVQNLRRQAAGAHLRSPADALGLLKADLVREMEQRPRALKLEGAPAVVLVVGVNGSGKTTTIGKLAYLLRREGRRPLLAAGDTFRAAAIDQLRLWGERAGVEVVALQPGSVPGAVAFDAGQGVTTMDGSGGAGVVLSIEAELSVPVKLVGIGEGLEDLNRFDPGQYLDALLRMEEAG